MHPNSMNIHPGDVFPEFRSKCEGREDFRGSFSLLYNSLLGLMPQGIHTHPQTGLPFFTGYSYGTLYDWDQYFEAILQFYCGYPTTYAINAIRLFLKQQHEDGHIVRTVPEFAWSKREHVKPFLCQIAFLCYLVDGHLDWLNTEVFEGLARYIEHWTVHLAPREGGLPVWDCASHSGMDNHMERAGSSGSAYCEGVDLASYLVRETLAMSLLADITKRPADSARFHKISEDIRTKIADTMWNSDEGMLRDIDARTGKHIPINYAGVFAALWANAVDERQAQKMIESHLLNPEEFRRPFPVPTLAKSESGYVEGFIEGDTQGCCSWRAHTWIPTNYYIMHGLVNYGRHEIALELAKRTYEMFFYHPFSEYYTSEIGIGTGLKPFWGWSGLAIFMPFEAVLGIDPTRLSPDNDAFVRMRRAVTSLI